MADKSNKKTPEWTRSKDDSVFSRELYLPSFNIYITRSDPSASVIQGGWGNYDIALESGDAISVSYLDEKNEVFTADQDFRPLDPSYLRRILLQVLDREEYQEAVEYYQAQERWEEVDPELSEGQSPTIRGRRRIKDADPRAQVRISDLRLANDLTSKNFRDFKDRLDQALSSLQLPITKDSVTRWKYKVLEGKSRRERELEEQVEALRSNRRSFELSVEEEDKYNEEWHQIMEQENAWVTLVSFTAAALLLLHDLDMRNLKDANNADLTKSVNTLANIFRALMGSVDRSVEGLSTLLANRRPEDGPLPHPEIKLYTALVLYRMMPPSQRVARRTRKVDPLRRVARRIGITPREVTLGDELKGSKNWKTQLFEYIRRGIEIERARFPRAAEVFTRISDEGVRTEAMNAYYDYREELERSVVRNYVEEFEEGDEMIGGPHNEREEMQRALVQLGCCIVNRRDPLPSSSSVLS